MHSTCSRSIKRSLPRSKNTLQNSLLTLSRKHFNANTCTIFLKVPQASFSTNQPQHSKLRFLQKKESFLEYDDVRKLDHQQKKYIEGGVSIIVRDMKPLVRQGNTAALLNMYDEMRAKYPEWAIRSNWIPFHIQMLQAFVRKNDVEACDQWFRENFNTSYSANPHLPSPKGWEHYNTLMSAYANQGDLKMVNKLKDFCFTDVPQATTSVEVHTTILKAYIVSENVEEAQRYFFNTFRTSIRPFWMARSEVSFASQRLMPTTFTYFLMVSFYGKYGFVDRANEMYEGALRDIPKEATKSVELHNGMMEAYALASGEYEMMSVFSGVFRSTLTAETRNNRLLPSTYTYIIMMDFYLKKGDPKSVIFLFNLMMNDKSLFNNVNITAQEKLYITLIDAYLEIGNIDQVLSTLYYRNIRYYVDVFLKVLSYLADHGLEDKMRALVRHMQERFETLPDEVLSYLVSAYCKNDVWGALRIFHDSFVSPVEGNLSGATEVHSLNPAAGILTPSLLQNEKLVPSADLVGELLWSMAKHNLPDLLNTWIDSIHAHQTIPLDVDLMNYLLLTMIQSGHVESAGSFALRYFTDCEPGRPQSARFEGNDRTIEIMKEGDILVFVESQIKKTKSQKNAK
uniref:Uncharacterized protein n=1 Tax=Percolomonas cosmopolitus TaxID=63605 RepID=A0A7S1KUD4_9EUKA